jgi:hypothetical protein
MIFSRMKTSSFPKVISKVRLGEQPGDALYWRTQSLQARLSALEEIRQEYHQWKFHAEPGLQRFYSILKR